MAKSQNYFLSFPDISHGISSYHTVVRINCDDYEEFGPRGVQRDFHPADHSQGWGQTDPAHGLIQRDLNKLKYVVNILKTNEITKTNNPVDLTKQKKKAALLRALYDLMIDSSKDEVSDFKVIAQH